MVLFNFPPNAGATGTAAYLSVFESLGQPTLLGTSRKGFIGKLNGVERPEDRVFGSIATAVWGVANGASIVRVHDVAATVQALRVTHAIQRAS